MNKYKIFIETSIQKERFELLLKYSLKHNILINNNIELVDKYKNSDLIIFLVNSGNNLLNLDNKYNYLFETNIPIILLERQDSAITWCRDIHKIKNLKAIFKNRILKDTSLQNTNNTYYGKYQYFLVKDIISSDNIEIIDNSSDLGTKYYKKNNKLLEIPLYFLNNIKAVLWDFHSSPLCDHKSLSMKYFRNNNIDFKKKYDIFCVNQIKSNNLVNEPRQKAKKIVQSLSNKYNVITNNLKKDEYEKIFSKSKICVACWGFGEWVHMDAYALYAGVILIKPNTDHVLMYPDIYKSYETYIPCNYDYSNLKEVIEDTIQNYDKYIPMLKKNREILMNVNEKKSCELFWKQIIDHL